MTIEGGAVMGTGYEQQIVDAMVRRAAAIEQGDDAAAAAALVEAGQAADRLRTRRRSAVPPWPHSER